MAHPAGLAAGQRGGGDGVYSISLLGKGRRCFRVVRMLLTEGGTNTRVQYANTRIHRLQPPLAW